MANILINKIMRHHQVIGVLLFVLALIGPIPLQASIVQSFTFNKNTLAFENDTINGVLYTKVSMAGLNDKIDEEGKPCLPFTHVNVSVPYNASNIQVSSVVSGTTNYTLGHKVVYVPRYNSLNDSIPIEYTYPDSAIYYNQNSYYPAQRAVVQGNDYLFGVNNIVTILLYPIRYNGKLNKISVCSKITVTITYDTIDVTNENLPIRPLARYDSLPSSCIAQVQNLVTNSSAVIGNMMPLEDSVSGSAHSPSALPAIFPPAKHEHMIITTRELAPAFKRLVAWRKARGLNCAVVCIEDIMATTPGAYLLYDKMYQLDAAGNKTLVEVTDSASILRGYLRFSQMMGVPYGSYALLAINGVYRPYKGIPSDMYFTDLTTTWNINIDGTYDFDESNSTMQPDIMIGRLMCNSVEDVENYVDKVIRYERNPGNGDLSYLKRGVYTECDWMQLYHWSDVHLPQMTSTIIDDYTLFYQYDFHTPTGTDVISNIDSIHYGLWALQGHGSPLAISVNYLPQYIGQMPYGIMSTLAHPAHHIIESGNALDCMTQSKYYPSVCYSISCSVMPFDQYKNPNKWPNFGQSFTCGKNYGGVAFLGNTRDGYGESISLERAFFNQVTQGNTCIGMAEALSRSVANYPSVTEQAMRVRAAHNLMGDPAINLWTSAVDSIVFNPPLRILYGNTTTIVYNYYTTNPTSFWIFNNNNLPIMVQEDNKLPYFIPCHMQNVTFTRDEYVFAGYLKAGKAIDEDRTRGDVVFQSEFTIEASQDVDLYDGVVIDTGAIVDISTPANINVYGGVVRSGGTLKLRGRTSLASDFRVEQGGKLEILPYSD